MILFKSHVGQSRGWAGVVLLSVLGLENRKFHRQQTTWQEPKNALLGNFFCVAKTGHGQKSVLIKLRMSFIFWTVKCGLPDVFACRHRSSNFLDLVRLGRAFWNLLAACLGFWSNTNFSLGVCFWPFPKEVVAFILISIIQLSTQRKSFNFQCCRALY